MLRRYPNRFSVSIAGLENLSILPHVNIDERLQKARSFSSFNDAYEDGMEEDISDAEIRQWMKSKDVKRIDDFSFSVIDTFSVTPREIIHESLERNSLHGLHLQTLLVDFKQLESIITTMYQGLKNEGLFTLRLIVATKKSSMYTLQMIQGGDDEIQTRRKAQKSLTTAGLKVEKATTESVILSKSFWNNLAKETMCNSQLGIQLLGAEFSDIPFSKLASTLSARVNIAVINFAGQKPEFQDRHFLW